jgi:integral membrane sensor domain MASE1
MKNKLLILLLIPLLLTSCQSIFVWTLGDVIGLSVFGFFVLVLGYYWLKDKIRNLFK